MVTEGERLMSPFSPVSDSTCSLLSERLIILPWKVAVWVLKRGLVAASKELVVGSLLILLVDKEVDRLGLVFPTTKPMTADMTMATTVTAVFPIDKVWT